MTITPAVRRPKLMLKIWDLGFGGLRFVDGGDLRVFLWGREGPVCEYDTHNYNRYKMYSPYDARNTPARTHEFY